MTDRPSAALAPYSPPRPIAPIDQDEERDLFQTAKALAASGLWKDARKGEEAYAKIIIGRDLGLTPAEAMAQLHVIDGKVEASADLHATRVRQHPHYDYTIERLDNEGCVLLFTRLTDGKTFESSFTIEDAERAGLPEPSRKKDANGRRIVGTGTWDKFPRNMLFARAMSNGVAWFCPEVMGGLRVYTPGEIVPAPTDDLTRGEGSGDGVAQLPPEVLAVIERARSLGHAGLANADSAAMALHGASPEAVQAWVERATVKLDALAVDEELADVEVVDEKADALGSMQERAKSAGLGALAEGAQVAAAMMAEQQTASPPGTPPEERIAGTADSFLGDDIAEGARRSMLATAERFEQEGEEARSAGREEDAAQLFAEADQLRSQVAAMGDDGQESMPL